MTQENQNSTISQTSDEHDGSIPTLSLTLGQKLKAAREEKGLSAGDVAGHLKLSVRQVEALENNAFERLPNAVFIRGFMRSYAKFLKMDEQSIIQELDKILPLSHHTPTHTPTNTNEITQSDINQSTSSPNNPSNRLFAIVAALLIMIGIGGYYLFAGKAPQEIEQVNNDIPSSIPAISSEIEASIEMTDNASQVAIPASEENSLEETENIDKLVIHNRYKTYMTVINNKGDVLLNSKLVPANSTQLFPAADAPYKIRIGYALDTSVKFKGQSINFSEKIKKKTLEITIPETNTPDNISDVAAQ